MSAIRETLSSRAISVNASQKASSRLTLVDVLLSLLNVCFRGFVGFLRWDIAMGPAALVKFLFIRLQPRARGRHFDSAPHSLGTPRVAGLATIRSGGRAAF